MIRKNLLQNRPNNEERRSNDNERDASSHYSQGSVRSHPTAPQIPEYDLEYNQEVPTVEVEPPSELAEVENQVEEEQAPCETSPTSSNDEKLEVPSIGPDSGTHSYISAVEVHHFRELDAISSASFQF